MTESGSLKQPHLIILTPGDIVKESPKNIRMHDRLIFEREQSYSLYERSKIAKLRAEAGHNLKRQQLDIEEYNIIKQ